MAFPCISLTSKNPYLKMKSHQKFAKVLQIFLTVLPKGICAYSFISTNLCH